MRVVHITDMHIGAEGEFTRDVDVRGNFTAVLQMALVFRPDRFVLGGDLCFSYGRTEVYQWIREQMEETGLPYDLVPGNHDDTAILAQVFERSHLLLPNGDMAYVKNMEGSLFAFLDTASGVLSEAQAVWLRQILSAHVALPVVFMHHPPAPVGMPYMDAHYPLQNPEQFAAAIEVSPVPVQVFCGHYHIEKSLHLDKMHIHVTPSTFFQIDPCSADFAVDHYRPAFRVIDLLPDGGLSHFVKYLDVAGW